MKLLLLFTIVAVSYAAQCGTNQYWDQEMNKCETCPTNCATCWSKTKCTSCVSDTYIIDSTYKCVEKTNVTNCKTQDGNNCVECNDEYYLQGNNCHPCNNTGVSNCLKCNMNKCFKCKDTYTLYENGTTQECIDCSKPENDEKCGRCKLGQYFDIDTLKCTNCRENCTRCTEKDNCYLCADNYALENPSDPKSKCVKLSNCKDGHYYGNHCELCNDGFYVLDGYCAKCGTACTRCVNNETCVECNQGATLKDGKCTSVPNCKRSSDLIGCLECESGYYLNGTNCTKCHDSCATCKTETHCFTCKANYYFTDKANGKCDPMDNTTCDVADQYGCLHCKSEIPYSTWNTFTNNTLNEQIKKKFEDSVKSELGYKTINEYFEAANKLNTDGTKDWNNVKVGYYIPYDWNSQINKTIYKQKCEMCDPGCIICEHNSSWCTACNPLYQMTKDEIATNLSRAHFGTNTTIYNCKKTNETCNKTTMGYCTECNNPNFLSGMDCISCHVSCQSCVDDQYCQTCNTTLDANGNAKYWRPKAYTDKETMKDKGACWNVTEANKQKYYLDNCEGGKITTSGCSSCKEGYYKNSNWGGCKKCPSQCVSCELKNQDYQVNETDYLNNNNPDADFEKYFKCTKCKAAEGSFAGEILKDDKCLECKTIEHCIKCSGTGDSCDECESSYERQSDGTCAISDLVIALPIVSVVAVIIIIIIIVIIILVARDQKKKRAERDKEIKPFKVSNEVEMALLSADNENFPLRTDKWELDFGLSKSKAIIDTEYEQKVIFENPTKKSYFFEILAGASHRYELIAEPMRYTLKAGLAVEVTFKIKMLCTAIVSDDIGIVAMDMDEDSKETAKMTIKVESDLSMKLDHTELKLEMPAIGEGAFGMVFKGTYRGQKVAVKKMKARNLTEEQEREFKHEVNMLTQYRHACVVNLVGAVYTEGEVSIVTEFADFGSLSKVWNKEKISYDLKVKFMEDAVVALSYLHENQIIHRDVKGENVLVYSLNPHSPVCGKLTDFGTCRNISERALQTKELTQGIGTPTYMAPECLGNNNYHLKADVYSFGIVLYETYIEQNAYDSDNDERFKQPWMIPQFVIEGKRLERPSGIPNDYWGLVEKCWAQDPDNRPTFPQIYATLAALKNVDITHTETSNKGQALDVPEAEEEFGEGSSSSSSSSEEEE